MLTSLECYKCNADFLLTLTVFAAILIAQAAYCPPQVDIHLFNCTGSGLMAVPRRVHPETRILDLSNNHLKVLHEDSFTEYHRLGQLILDHNDIYKITDRAMNSISMTLRHLSLRGNRLSMRSSSNFPLSALSKLRNLRILDLSENPLGVISTNWAAPLGDTLRILRLSSLVGRVEVEKNAFAGLGRLEELNFSNNSFYKLPENAFSGIRQEKLKRLNLRNIPWHCDCTLLWLRQWLGGLRLTTAPYEAPITGPCSHPTKFGNIPMINQPISQFQCSPQLQIMDSNAPHYFGEQKDLMHVSPSVGESITLTCTFVSQPKMLVQWYKNGALLRPELKRFAQSVSKGSKFSTVLTISQLRAPTDNGNYICKTSNNRGSARGVFVLKIFNPVSSAKYLLDEAQPTEGQHNSRDAEIQLRESPRILVISFAAICVCVICGVGLLIILLLFHIRNRRTRIQCQSTASLATETFENEVCFEATQPPPPPALPTPPLPPPLPPPHSSFKSGFPCIPPSILDPGLVNRTDRPSTTRLDEVGLSYSPNYRTPRYTPSSEHDDVRTENRDKPVVRTFAPFMTSGENENADDVDDDDDENEEEAEEEEEEGESEDSSNGVDKTCPVHGSFAREEANFCPVHSHSFLANTLPWLSSSLSSKEITAANGTDEIRRQWSTLQGYGKSTERNGSLLQRRINSATVDLSLLKY